MALGRVAECVGVADFGGGAFVVGAGGAVATFFAGGGGGGPGGAAEVVVGGEGWGCDEQEEKGDGYGWWGHQGHGWLALFGVMQSPVMA